MPDAHGWDNNFGNSRQPRKPRPDLSTVEKRNQFYNGEEYRNMTTAEKCVFQGDGFINDYD